MVSSFACFNVSFCNVFLMYVKKIYTSQKF